MLNLIWATVVFVLVFASVVFYVHQILQTLGWLAVIYWLLIWTWRLRYGIAVTLAPLALGAIAWWNKDLFLALLLARPDAAWWDLNVITAMSLCTTGLVNCFTESGTVWA